MPAINLSDRGVEEKMCMEFNGKQYAVCFLWLSLPGDYRVTDEALLAETT